MKQRNVMIAGLTLTGLIAIGVSPRVTAPKVEAEERTIFNDSALHAAACVPNRKGESWRAVCELKDQRP